MPDQRPFFEMPDGVTEELAVEVVATLDKLFTHAAADDENRYFATRQVLWQMIAAMMSKGVEDRFALQIMISACTELLTRAIGPSEAAAHLHLMGDRVSSLQRH